MQRIRSSPPRQHTNNDGNIPKGLDTATHIFICQDAIHKPLQPLYDGPFLVVKRTDKHYTIDINGQKDTVSIDRLKPAHLDDNPPPIRVNHPTSHPYHSLWMTHSFSKPFHIIHVMNMSSLSNVSFFRSCC